MNESEKDSQSLRDWLTRAVNHSLVVQLSGPPRDVLTLADRAWTLAGAAVELAEPAWISGLISIHPVIHRYRIAWKQVS